MSRVNLDVSVLRTFVAGFELGSFARAAERLGRSQSAVSTQLRKLEEQLGQKLVHRTGRRLALTTAGESLFGYAKRLLELNDEAVEAVRRSEGEGWVQLGLPQDIAERWLPSVLHQFSHAHPNVRVEVEVGRSAALLTLLRKGELDIAMVWGDGGDAPFGVQVADFATHWIGRPDWQSTWNVRGEPLPFAAFTPPCPFRTAAVEALDAGGLPWRLVFTSPSLSGLWAAVESGVGITARVAAAVPSTLTVLDAAAMGLPDLPNVPLAIHTAEAGLRPAAGSLRKLLLNAIRREPGQGAVHTEPASFDFFEA